MTALFFLLVACGQKLPPEAPVALEVPQVVEAVSVPLAVLLPDAVPAGKDTWPPLPPQPGLSPGQELTQALSSRVLFTVEADVSALGALDDQHAAQLCEELAADPRWKVTRWADQTVAFARSRLGTGWSVGWGGYAGADPLSRVALWFGPPPWRSDAQVNAVGPSAEGPTLLEASGWPVGGAWEGQTGALLAVKGRSLSLEVHELARDLQLVHTARALSRVPTRLEEAVHGGAPRHPVAPAEGDTEAVWAAAWDETGVDLRLLVQPKAAGWTWVRLLGPEGALQEELVLRSSLERLGTGPEAQSGQSWLPISGLPDAVQVEVWFQADAGGRPEQLYAAALARP